MSAEGLTFLSWVRTGLISSVAAPTSPTGNPLDAELPVRATLPVELTVSGGAADQYDASLVGPGDVTGLDAAQVIRTDPAAGAVEVEPNYFAAIEFDRPDLPWLLTPTQPAEETEAHGARRGLRPWLCLIVLPDRTLDPPTAIRPLARVTALASELPPLEEAWLWAHAQVLTEAGDDVGSLLESAPERTRSRLLAPRRLHPAERYVACVVPTFEAGRRAGLGLDPPSADQLAHAWDVASGDASIQLPVYYHWRFTTARSRGDFEYLARKMKPSPMGNAGVRPLDVGAAGAGLPGPQPGDPDWRIDLEGVLIGSEIEPGRWDAPGQQALADATALRLAGTSRELSPPTYGKQHAGYEGDLTGGAGPAWLRTLNLDPRYRAVASLGTRIVQQHQEALVASAWEQSAAIREANRLLRQAQMARTVGEAIHGRIVGPRALPPDRLLQLTRPVHHQFRAIGAASPTVATAIEINRGVRAAVSVPFRRIGRPRGPVARRLAPGPLPAPVARLGLPAGSALALRPTPELAAFDGTVGLETVASGLGFASLTASLVLEPRLAWEAGVTVGAPSRKVPHAFLSDLVVTTQQRPEFGWQQPITAAAIGRALDFDGAPQLGWEPSDQPPVMPVGFGTWEEGYAANFVEFGSWRGLLAIRRSTWWANRNVFSGTIEWTSGYMLETHNPTDTAPADPILGELLRGLAIAGADLADADRLDVVVVWSDESEFPIGMSMSQRMTKTFIAVGLDFDPAGGTFDGGWSTTRELEEGGGPYSLAASGSQIFLLRDRNLRIETLTSTGAVASSTIVDLGSVLPEDYAGGAIAAADFGGGTGVDLLVYYVAGGGASLRAGYRVAFEVQPDGSIGAWGDPMPAPVHTAGPEVGVLLGPADPDTTARRVEATEAFREAAAATQNRQTRVAALAAPPPPAPDVDATSLVGDIEQGLDVPTRVAETVHARLSLAQPIDPASVGDMLQPLALSPRFPYPTYELFRDAFQDRLFPGASTLPDDSVAALLVNDDAMESFLIGMNHEMSRELLWRDYPLRDGTYFQRFWDARRDDIDPIDGWADGSALGDHEPAATPTASMLLVVRAELVRRIPDVTIYAAPARPGDSGSGRTPDLSARKDPLFGGHLHPDIRFFGFDLTEEEVRGAGPTDGWYFVFQESPTGRRFGLNESLDRFGTTPAAWNELDWSQLAADQAALDNLVHADGGSGSRLRDVSLPDGGESVLSHRWGFSAAHMAHITLQRPVQVAIHGSDLLEAG